MTDISLSGEITALKKSKACSGCGDFERNSAIL
jgi:hypothetical protein